MPTPDDDLELQLALSRARRKRAKISGATEGSMSDVFSETTRSLVGAVPEGLPAVRGAVAGASGSLASLPEGIRQLFNVVTGDEEELAALNQETAQRQAAQRELVGENTGAELVGSVAGTLIPGIAAARGLQGISLGGRALSGPSAIGETARTAGAGTIGGILGGAAQALGPEQEQSGERGLDAIIGGLLGGTAGAVIPPIARGGAKFNEWRRKVHPLDAMEDFFSRSTGTQRGTDRAAIVSELRDKTENKISGMKKAFDKLYAKIEKNPNLPEIPLAETYIGQGADPALIETLGRHGSAARVLKLTKEATENPVGILGPSGQLLSAPHQSASFEDVSRTRKYLRDLAYNETDSARKQVLLGALDRLEQDVAKWSATSPEAATAIGELNTLDNLYRDRMGPLINRGTPVGDWKRAGFTEKRLDNALLSPRSGAEVSELSRRVPGTKTPARQYYASKTLSADGKKDLLRSNSTRDTLFAPGEREYMDRLADALRKQEEEGALVKGLEALNQKLGSPLRVDRSMLPYGQYPMAPARRNALADIVRGWMGSRAITTEE